MIYYIPLENMEQRYTRMMNNQFERHADFCLYPTTFEYSDTIETGQFLDINKTCIFKAMQLEIISKMFYNKEIKNGDIFIVGDIFFPGIEMLRYMAELQNIVIKIYGFNYAGRADETDFVRRLGKWSDFSEEGYLSICDGIFVGSANHRKNIMKYFPDLEFEVPIYVTGYIWSVAWNLSICSRSIKKKDYVIFPHRLSKEKGLSGFLKFCSKNPEKKIIITSGGNRQEIDLPPNVEYRTNLNKYQYLKIMSEAKYYLSTAYQETFGYTLQEAILYGCQILVPNRACYPEMVPERNLYETIEETTRLFEGGLTVPPKYTFRWDNNVASIMDLIKLRELK